MNDLRYPWDDAPPRAGDPDAPRCKPKPRGRRPAFTRGASAPAGAPDWLYHHLTISGPDEAVHAFAAAACGSGVIPWPLDVAAIEEQVFALAVSQPAPHRRLTVDGCRILARQFRDRLEAHQARAVARVGHSRACPFDLYRLLPIPPELLQRGPADPAALAWLATHWGITDRLRQVGLRPKPTIGRRLPKHHTVIGYGFFTDGETPHAAIGAIAARWPMLRFRLAPRPTA